MGKFDEAKRKLWALRIDGWRASGKSQRAYCRQAGYSFFCFNYWRKRQTHESQTHESHNTAIPIKAAPKAPTRRTRTQAAARGNRKPIAALTLLPVQFTTAALPTSPPAVTASERTLSLLSPKGWQLILPSPVDPLWLASLLVAVAA